MKKIMDVRSLQQRVDELESSLRSRDETILSLEREKSSLEERMRRLVFRYGDSGSEIASMNFRLYQLTQANKILTMKLTATAAQRDALQKGLLKLKEQTRGGNDE